MIEEALRLLLQANQRGLPMDNELQVILQELQLGAPVLCGQDRAHAVER